MIYSGVILILGAILFPFIWLFAASFETEKYLTGLFHIFPIKPTLANYIRLFDVGGGIIGKNFVHSVIISSLTMVLTVIISTPPSYALARYKRQKKLSYFMNFFLWVMSILPGMAIVIPIYIFARALHIYDTYLLMVLVYTALLSPLAILMLIPFFESIPAELEESSRMDGCTRLQALVKILIPLAIPGVVATAVFTFISSWNDFLYGLLLTGNNVQPLTVGIATLISIRYTDAGVTTAGGVISLLPPVVLALIFQKYLMKGLLEGALKF